MPEALSRPAWVEVDLDAVRHNAAALLRVARPAALCAVVKADGYGHGAVALARAALEGGATWLAVAVVEEGLALRQSGITAPVLLLSEPPFDAIAEAVRHHLTLTLYTPEGVEQAAAAARAVRRDVAVHVKVDTGMHRVGASCREAVDVACAVAAEPSLYLEGLWTHFAVADEELDGGYTVEQVARFEAVRDELATRGVEAALLHASNSAGALGHPGARYDLVRCGIALYGHSPASHLASIAELRPALSLKARVTHVRALPAGERISYGRRYELTTDAVVATVPLGYADGVTRRLSAVGAEVLIGGQRRPIAGTVTMDQLMVDCGPDASVAVGDEVVLIGRQGSAEITAEEWASRLDTISYEVLCGIGPRVPRVLVGTGAAATAAKPRPLA